MKVEDPALMLGEQRAVAFVEREEPPANLESVKGHYLTVYQGGYNRPWRGTALDRGVSIPPLGDRAPARRVRRPVRRAARAHHRGYLRVDRGNMAAPRGSRTAIRRPAGRRR